MISKSQCLTRTLALALCATSILVPRVSGQGTRQAPRPSPSLTVDLDRLFKAYEQGDPDVVIREIGHLRPEEVPALPAEVSKFASESPGNFDPVRATFLIEIGVALFADPYQPPAENLLPAIVGTGREYVAIRPGPATGDSDADAFVWQWHRLAIALLQGATKWQEQQDYLRALYKRYGVAALRAGYPRTALAEAIARTQRCCEYAHLMELEDLGYWNHGVIDEMRKALADPIAAFATAAKAHDVRNEALVRGALLLIHRRLPEQALEWLDQFEDNQNDHVLAYWAAFFRARTLEALGRPTDAERAYHVALEIWPDAQSAEVGLSLALVRLGRRDDGPETAIASSRALGKAHDPLWLYDGADVRFVPEWLRVLRLRRASR